jgi:DNA-binding winged helix-turn-helix (wHTH) protein
MAESFPIDRFLAYRFLIGWRWSRESAEWNPTVHKILLFDRFALDLTRGCLRSGDKDIDLRPKAFEVLRHLVENAGRLVAKRELHEAVWPKVEVGDDSLVQCIRELRQKLGDDERRLIKTVSRRGYLLDATVTAPARHDLARGLAADPAREPRKSTATALRGFLPLEWRPWAAGGIGLVCIALATAYLLLGLAAPWHEAVDPTTSAGAGSTPPVGELFSETHARRVAAIAEKKQLPIPSFRISKPAKEVADNIRRFVGIWVSDTGFVNSKRQFMMIVMNVAEDGTALGYTVRGPAQPRSQMQSPPASTPFTAHISGDTLRFNTSGGHVVASLIDQDRMHYKEIFSDATMASVMLDPVWTLAKAERALAANRADK